MCYCSPCCLLCRIITWHGVVAYLQDVKKLKTEEMQLRIAKNKRRSLGNIRFIGELFKLSMLTEKIMHECILQLLKSIDEESLECMCRLLTTVGKLIDTDKGKVRSCDAVSDLGRIDVCCCERRSVFVVFVRFSRRC